MIAVIAEAPIMRGEGELFMKDVTNEGSERSYGGATPPRYVVYILRCKDDSLYVGCTSNLGDRIMRHQKGYIISTKNRLPVTLLTTINFQERHRAFLFEKYLKTGSGRAFLNKRLV